jgi:hypothetical protein
MTKTFTDFLRERATEHQEAAQSGKAVVEEWRQAIEKLFERFKAWLADSDPEHFIRIETVEHQMSEKGLGRYQVPALHLSFFGKNIFIIPKARNTVGSAHPPQSKAPQRASGRVDITDEVRRHVLYRFRQENGEDLWLIEDPAGETPQPLDQQLFEKVLMSYLR